jgi:hypothetical protein
VLAPVEAVRGRASAAAGVSCACSALHCTALRGAAV